MGFIREFIAAMTANPAAAARQLRGRLLAPRHAEAPGASTVQAARSEAALRAVGGPPLRRSPCPVPANDS